MPNKILPIEEFCREVRKYGFNYACERGWYNPMFIEWQYNYERVEFDVE